LPAPDRPISSGDPPEIAERYLLVAGGSVTELPDFRSLVADERMRTYLDPKMRRIAETLI
jgi:hypothetical protein